MSDQLQIITQLGVTTCLQILATTAQVSDITPRITLPTPLQLAKHLYHVGLVFDEQGQLMPVFNVTDLLAREVLEVMLGTYGMMAEG